MVAYKQNGEVDGRSLGWRHDRCLNNGKEYATVGDAAQDLGINWDQAKALLRGHVFKKGRAAGWRLEYV